VIFQSYQLRLGLLLLCLACLSLATATSPALASFFTQESIEKLAPVVIFHHKERTHPTSGKEFLDHSGLAFGHDQGCPPDYQHHRIVAGRINRWTDEEIASLGQGGFLGRLRSSKGSGCRFLPGPENVFTTRDLTRPWQPGRSPQLRHTDGWYLDIADDDRGGLPDLGGGSNQYRTAAPTYYDDGLLYSADQPSGYAFVTYWFLYPYNDGFGPQNHEGDWEDVSVRLRPLGADAWEPVEVFYARHGRSKDTLAWERVPKLSINGETRVQVLAARGSHASYPAPPGIRDFYDKVDEDGPRWYTWKRLRFLWDQGWAGYCGAWGSVGGISDTSGPLGAACFDPGGRPVKSGRPGAWGGSQARNGAFSGGNTIRLTP
jgi:hypothetical protein